MDANNFADWSLVILGALLCVLGLSILGYALYAQVRNADSNREFRLTPILIGAALIWFGATILDAFDTLGENEDSDSSQQQRLP